MNNRKFAHQALHGWQFHDNPTYCRNENMAYKGNLLISYNTVIGVYDKRHQFTILTPYFYSNTTAHHKSFYAQASPYSVFYLCIPTGGSLEFSDSPKLEVDNKDKYSFKTKSLRDIIIYNINKVKSFIKDIKSDKYIDSDKNTLRSDREFYRSLICSVSLFYDYLIRNKSLKSNKKLLKDIEVLSNALAKRKTIVNTFWSQPEGKQLNYIKNKLLSHIDPVRSSSLDNINVNKIISTYVKNKDSCGIYHFMLNHKIFSYGALKYVKRLACVKDKGLKHVEKDICFFEQITPSKEEIVSSKGFSVTMKTVKFLIKTFWRNQGRDVTFKQIQIDNYHFDICVYSNHVRIGCHIIPYFVIDNLKEQIQTYENENEN